MGKEGNSTKANSESAFIPGVLCLTVRVFSLDTLTTFVYIYSLSGFLASILSLASLQSEFPASLTAATLNSYF